MIPYRRRCFALPLALAFVLGCGWCFAQVIFDSSFECGNGRNFTEITTDTYSLEIEPDTNSSDRQWYCFEVRGAQGKTLTFRILNTNTTNVPGHWSVAVPVASSDGGTTWAPITGATSSTSSTYTFSHTVTSAAERLAYHYPYPFSRHEGFLSKWSAHPDVETIPLGRSVEDRPIDLLRITSTHSLSSESKIGIWVIARQHSAEVTASYALEGFMEFVLSSDPAALALRRNAVVNVVPFVNPDGATHGNYRNNARGINLNRVWNGTASELTSPEVKAIETAIAAWVAAGNPYHLFVDLHSISGANPHFAYHSDSATQPPLYPTPPTYHADSRRFLALVNSSAPMFHPTNGVTPSTDQRLAYTRQRIRYGVLAFTFEGGYVRHYYGPTPNALMTPDVHRRIGDSLGRAMVDYYALGSVPFDGWLWTLY